MLIQCSNLFQECYSVCVCVYWGWGMGDQARQFYNLATWPYFLWIIILCIRKVLRQQIGSRLSTCWLNTMWDAIQIGQQVEEYLRYSLSLGYFLVMQKNAFNFFVYLSRESQLRSLGLFLVFLLISLFLYLDHHLIKKFAIILKLDIVY